jgi:hypothetical protein
LEYHKDTIDFFSLYQNVFLLPFLLGVCFHIIPLVCTLLFAGVLTSL